MKPRAFFFHYNKPASKAAQKPVISVHYKGACHLVDNVHCDVPIRGRIGKRQPFFVMAGRGFLQVKDWGYMGGRVAIVTPENREVI